MQIDTIAHGQPDVHAADMQSEGVSDKNAEGKTNRDTDTAEETGVEASRSMPNNVYTTKHLYMQECIPSK